MKKITLILLVAMLPFLTMAQKRIKKNKTTNTEKSVEFLVIKGIEFFKPKEGPTKMNAEELMYANLKRMQHSEFMISYDFGGAKSQENLDLIRQGQEHRTMTSALNAAAAKGWEFQSANVLDAENAIMHYYYMKRSK